MSAAIEQRNQDATLWVGNLDDQVEEELLWELMLQAGPVTNVHIPRDRITNEAQGYSFVEFKAEEDAVRSDPLPPPPAAPVLRGVRAAPAHRTSDPSLPPTDSGH